MVEEILEFERVTKTRVKAYERWQILQVSARPRCNWHRSRGVHCGRFLLCPIAFTVPVTVNLPATLSDFEPFRLEPGLGNTASCGTPI